MNLPSRVIGAALLTAVATTAFADPKTEVLFQRKNWIVQGVTYDDGSLACVAEVDDARDSFAIYAYADKSLSLEFYSKDWDFGDKGDTADLVVKIDRRDKWNLTGADLKNQSVWFNLPDEDTSVNFLTEVASGNTLHLSAADGSSVMDYTLSGSAASMSAMIDCGNSISRSSNPFKK